MYKLLLFLLLVPSFASAEIYKCTNSAGQIEFRQTPCLSGNSELVQSSPAVKIPKPELTARYMDPLELPASTIGKMAKISALMDIANIKARDCRVDLEVRKKYDTCKDFLAFIVEGSQYDQAMQIATNLTTEEIKEVEFEYKQLFPKLKRVIQAKEFALASIKQL
ncbi:DUF4124 domain-containing protein [Pseudomonas sp. F1_0610]|uniref:DUF4124 domain-containing protein n=1 Tax=Pseudomonas sp. F1_0610 TaxID=3114284 RepID=UPI0039C240AB